MAGFSYLRSCRLKTRFDYARCRNPRCKRVLGKCHVFWRENGLNHARLGCSIPRKMGSSPERNLFRRRLKEAFRTASSMKSFSYDIHIIPQEAVSRFTWDDIKALIEHIPLIHPERGCPMDKERSANS